MVEAKKSGRVIGVDFGLKRIGLALSDAQRIIASPLPNLLALSSQEATADALVEHIQKLQIEKRCVIETIVVGMPLRMNGSDSTTTTSTKSFIEILKKKVTIPVEILDERLTSVQAERALMELNFSRKKRATLVDQVSATILLQCYLDIKGNEPLTCH